MADKTINRYLYFEETAVSKQKIEISLERSPKHKAVHHEASKVKFNILQRSKQEANNTSTESIKSKTPKQGTIFAITLC